jgi:hypothetical protein
MITCKHCGSPTTNPKFCSKSCSAKETNKIPKRPRVIKKCTHCNEDALYHSYFCEKHQEYSRTNRSKEILQERPLSYYFSRECLKNLHQSSRSVHIRGLARSWFKELAKLPCAKCGYSKHVELCHIRPIKDFPSSALLKEVNSKENLIQLCPNCHWELDNL